jgi:hypothetical protein
MKNKQDNREIKLEKRIKNSSGDILIRQYKQTEDSEYYEGMPIIEALNLYNKNKSGCVIVFWELRKCDGSWILEAHEIHDRLTETKFDEGVLEEMFYFGRKLSNVFTDFIITKVTTPSTK